MEQLRFERTTEAGPDALYRLLINGEQVADNLTLDEVLEEISRREELEVQK